MANQVIAAYDGTTDSSNIQAIVRGTASADLITSAKAIAAADTFEIDVQGNDDIIIIMEEGGSDAAVVTFDAGDNPPSPRAGLGSDAVTIPQADTVLYIPEAGRHVQSDGKITGSVATAGIGMWVFRAPAGFIGTAFMNTNTIPAAPTD